MRYLDSANDDWLFYRLADDLAGDPIKLDKLISASLDDRSVTRAALLKVAAANGNLQALERLWQNAEFSMKEGRLALSEAASCGQLAALHYLLSKGVSAVWLAKDLPAYPENIAVHVAETVQLPATRHREPILLSLVRDGLPSSAAIALLRRQGYTTQAAVLSATGILEKLSPEDRANLVSDIVKGAADCGTTAACKQDLASPK